MDLKSGLKGWGPLLIYVCLKTAGLSLEFPGRWRRGGDLGDFLLHDLWLRGQIKGLEEIRKD